MPANTNGGRGVGFLDELVVKILRGEKDQTRRIIRSKDFLEYGGVGGLLYIRETVKAERRETGNLGGELGLRYRADDTFAPLKIELAGWSEWGKLHGYQGTNGRWVPPLHAPRWASRLTLRIVETRSEPVQSITRADAIREGMGGPNPVGRFRDTWALSYGPKAWGRNDFVQVITFELLRENIDEVIAWERRKEKSASQAAR